MIFKARFFAAVRAFLDMVEYTIGTFSADENDSGHCKKCTKNKPLQTLLRPMSLSPSTPNTKIFLFMHFNFNLEVI